MSSSSVSFNTDVNVRYERLAAEYAKLRSQAKVLREGVLSERAKNEKLKDDFESSEASVRKLRNENESLQFRNEQLARRVEALQDEMEKTQRNGKLDHSSSKSKKSVKDAVSRDVIAQLNVMTNRVTVLEEELGDKLKQNEILITELSDLESKHSDEMAALSRKLREQMTEMEERVQRSERKERESHGRSRHSPRPVTAVRPMSEEKETGKKEGEEVKENEEREQQGRKGGNWLSIDTKSAQSVAPISPLPPSDEAQSQALETLRSTLNGLSTFFHLMSQRTEMHPFDSTMEPLPPHVKKLSSEYAHCSRLLSTSIGILDEIVEKGVMEWSSDGLRLRTSLSLFSRHSSTMLPPLIQAMVPEECKVTWCDSRLESLNQQWAELMTSLLNSMAVLCSLLEKEDIALIAEPTTNTAKILRDLSLCCSSRWSLESRLPTATRRLHCIGEAILDCSARVAQEGEKLAARIKGITSSNTVNHSELPIQSVIENISSGKKENEGANVNGEIENRMEEPLLDCSPVSVTESGVSDISGSTSNGRGEKREKEGNPFFSERNDKVKEECKECASKREVEGAEKESTEKPSYIEEVSRLQSRVIELETERERHLVDLSLLKRKISNLGGGAGGESKDGNKENIPLSETEHEREFSRQRLRSVMDEREKAEGRARHLHRECELLLRNARSCREDQKKLEEKVERLEAVNEALEDELSSVRRGYESQLFSLTEHVADLSAQLTTRECGKEERERKQTVQGGRTAGIKALFK